ncbi:Tex-like N-terminal domain-containing protein, partial [Larkinella sp. C7]
EEQGKLTPELKQAIQAAGKLAEVEELYLPYKEKRRTKATLAREAGLADLTRLILQNVPDLEAQAANFVSEGFPTADKALAGSLDILIEVLSEDNRLRSWTYNEIWNYSLLVSILKDASLDDKQVFQIYYDFSEKIKDFQGYRVLALNRGEKLGALKVGFEHHMDKIIRFYEARFKTRNSYID